MRIDPYELERENVVTQQMVEGFETRYPEFMAALRAVWDESLRRNFPDFRERFIALYVLRDETERQFSKLSAAIRAAVTPEQWKELMAEARTKRDGK